MPAGAVPLRAREPQLGEAARLRSSVQYEEPGPGVRSAVAPLPASSGDCELGCAGALCPGLCVGPSRELPESELTTTATAPMATTTATAAPTTALEPFRLLFMTPPSSGTPQQWDEATTLPVPRDQSASALPPLGHLFGGDPHRVLPLLPHNTLTSRAY